MAFFFAGRRGFTEAHGGSCGLSGLALRPLWAWFRSLQGVILSWSDGSVEQIALCCDNRRLFRQVGRFMPSGVSPLGAQVKKTLRALLGAALTRRDLVSRKQFDVQSALPVRIRRPARSLGKGISSL